MINMDEVKIRELQKEDCVALRKLIQGLADFQQMPDGPKLSAEDLERYAFEEHPRFYVYVADINGELIGYAIYYDTFSTWQGKSMFLDELYVNPAFRNKGVGGLLYDAVSKKAKASGCCRIEFAVLKWNPAADFYKRRGAVDLTEEKQWHYYRVDSDSL